MKKKFTLDNPMPPLWMLYPHIPKFSIGWRMGYGESYKYQLHDWKETLSEEERLAYQDLFPAPAAWRGYYDPEFDFEDGYYYHFIDLWTKDGKPKYNTGNIFTLDNPKYIFFWKPDANDIRCCLGQWQPSPFGLDINDFENAEQYMMFGKAELFEDETMGKQILNTPDPGKVKALGRKVMNFDQQVWDKAKYSIVLNGNYYKFTQNEKMRDYLLSTQDHVLAEASPRDKVWGIGLRKDHEKALNPGAWKGQNLLGFALMEVRDEIRRVYKNIDRIDFSQFN